MSKKLKTKSCQLELLPQQIYMYFKIEIDLHSNQYFEFIQDCLHRISISLYFLQEKKHVMNFLVFWTIFQISEY